jgi:hypothetical protein
MSVRRSRSTSTRMDGCSAASTEDSCSSAALLAVTASQRVDGDRHTLIARAPGLSSWRTACSSLSGASPPRLSRNTSADSRTLGAAPGPPWRC